MEMPSGLNWRLPHLSSFTGIDLNNNYYLELSCWQPNDDLIWKVTFVLQPLQRTRGAGHTFSIEP